MGELIKHVVPYINGYLVAADDVYIELRGKPKMGYPKLIQGNKPWDGGYLLLSEEERNNLIQKYPASSAFIKQYVGSHELINNVKRYCLWLKGVLPTVYRNIPEIMERLNGVKRHKA
jgi:hypothetical protein